MFLKILYDVLILLLNHSGELYSAPLKFILGAKTSLIPHGTAPTTTITTNAQVTNNCMWIFQIRGFIHSNINFT